MNLNNLTASRIRDLRKDKGYTIDAVARDLGISRTSYSQMENGHVEITLNRVEALAKAFNVSLEEIVPLSGDHYEVYNGNAGKHNVNTVNNFFANTEEKLQFIADNLLSALEEMRKKRNNENG